MTITIDIPDSIKDRVIDAVALDNGWRPGIGSTKAQFAKQVLLTFIKNSVKAYERNQATESARIAAELSVDTDIVLS